MIEKEWIVALVIFAVLFWFLGVHPPDCPGEVPVCDSDFQAEHPDSAEIHNSWDLKCGNAGGSDRCELDKFLNPLYNWNLVMMLIPAVAGFFITRRFLK